MVEVSSHNIYNILKSVMDPEIPVLSLVDLGVIVDVEVEETDVNIKMRPTFMGCPALDLMTQEIKEALNNEGYNKVRVEIVQEPAWTTDDISEEGRVALKKYGYTPPRRGELLEDLDILQNVECPRCSGTNTELISPFGPALCRAVHKCMDCLETFQSIKPLM